MGTSYPGTQAVIRAIKVLKLFGGQKTILTLAEVVERTELNKTTAFRLLSALEREGLVERSDNNGYRLGPEMVALGGRAIQQNGLIQTSEPLLNALMESVNERVTLEQPLMDGDGMLAMLLLIQVHSRHMIGINQLYGTRLPVHATSTGKAYLAFLAAERQEEISHRQLRSFTADTVVDTAELTAELAEIRDRGYALAIGELEVGLLAVGAPVFDHTGEPVAAISIEAPDSRIDVAGLHDMAQKLMKTAAQISERLGYRA